MDRGTPGPLPALRASWSEQIVAISRGKSGTLVYTSSDPPAGKHELQLLDLQTGRLRALPLPMTAEGNPMASAAMPMLVDRTWVVPVSRWMANPTGYQLDLVEMTGTSVRRVPLWSPPCRVAPDGAWEVRSAGVDRHTLRRVGFDGVPNSPTWVLSGQGPTCESSADTVLFTTRLGTNGQPPVRLLIDVTTLRPVPDVPAAVEGTQMIAAQGGTTVLLEGQQLVVESRLGKRRLGLWDQASPTGPTAIRSDETRLAVFVRSRPASPTGDGSSGTAPPDGLVIADLKTGVQRRFDMPHNGSVHWTADGRHVVVGLPNGIIVLDVESDAHEVVALPAVVRFGQFLGVTAFEPAASSTR